MKILWDEPKRLANIVSHGMDFADLNEDFFETSFVGPAKTGRFIAVGILKSTAIAVILRRLESKASASSVCGQPAGRKGN
jgi:uncharacterized DUF497 family protein